MGSRGMRTRTWLWSLHEQQGQMTHHTCRKQHEGRRTIQTSPLPRSAIACKLPEWLYGIEGGFSRRSISVTRSSRASWTWSSARVIYGIMRPIHIPFSSLDSQAFRMHHPIRAVTITAATAEKIRVNGFEILKQNNSSAIANITILSPNIRGRKSARRTFDKWQVTYAHISSAQGRLKIIAMGSKPKNRCIFW
jgi:hypothetical protein